MDPKIRGRLKAVCRLYEVMVGDLYGYDDIPRNRPGLEAYVLAFAVAANNRRHRIEP